MAGYMVPLLRWFCLSAVRLQQVTCGSGGVDRAAVPVSDGWHNAACVMAGM